MAPLLGSVFAAQPLLPVLDGQTLAFFRTANGALLLLFLLITLPHWRRFFLSERWGGYGQSAPDVDWLQRPASMRFVLPVWLGCAFLLLAGRWTLLASLLNLLACRYFFVRMRWKGVARGMGAPGFMTYWLALATFLTTWIARFAPAALPFALLVLQVDFACIMLSAGIYKLTAGYPRNHGMELGLVNPQWGYWWRFYRRLPPQHLLLRTLNQLAWLTEVVAAVLMLLPPNRFLGSVLIIGSFAFIRTHIRLGVLCEMVMLCGVLFFGPGTPGAAAAGWVMQRIPWASASTAPPAADVAAAGPLATAVHVVALAALGLYLACLLPAHAGLFANFYGRRTLPRLLQRALDAYTSFFGLIIWRVFSVDLINFFVRIYVQDGDGRRRLVSRYGWRNGLRFAHVAESIAITSVFTSLKYYASNPALFVDRLLRYARTIPCPPEAVLVFEYVGVRKTEREFGFVPLAEFVVDPRRNDVKEVTLDESVSVRAAHAVSPVHEGVRPGSYVPLAPPAQVPAGAGR